jgi:hypothetical protein
MMATFKTKFDLGDKVWKLERSTESLMLPCRFCRGSKWLPVEGAGEQSKSVQCPECRGHGSIELGTWPEWKVSGGQLQIGKIEVVVYDHTVERGEHAVSIEDAEKYMAVETGLGSGSVHSADDLFADREEAEVAAAARTARTRAGEKVGPWTQWWPESRLIGAAKGFLDHVDVYEHNAGHILLAEAIVAAGARADEVRRNG